MASDTDSAREACEEYLRRNPGTVTDTRGHSNYRRQDYLAGWKAALESQHQESVSAMESQLDRLETEKRREGQPMSDKEMGELGQFDGGDHEPEWQRLDAGEGG